jgi:hypothetical protein
LSTDTVESFDYVNLQDVDPSFQTLPTAVRTLQVAKAEIAPFTYKNGPKAGTEGQRLAFTFVVTDDAEYSGRRIFESLFPGTFTFKGLRRLMDATGIVQTEGTPLAEWLAELQSESPKFKIQVIQEDDIDRKTGAPKSLDIKGNPTKRNVLNWREVQPA